MNLSRSFTRQRGAVLFVGLIMLILITLLAVSAIRLANTNLLVVGNEQFQKEAEDAADYHLDLALNSNEFTARNVDRSATLPAFSGATATTETSYHVKIPPPVCKRYRYLKVGEMVNADNSVPLDDLPCIPSNALKGGINIVDAGALNDNSLCATSLWEMTAEVELPGTGAKTQVIQGVEMRIDYAEAKDACK
ncbi:hypothetical protein GPA22_18925 [Aromatoleum toluvorans]|uniref:Type 4 fimbrial biogenesis protein PilX N-terminal domain-containing protein n=1 Tax=Aromatoleum toluvorans TaxID=92002 RepID=A0ABX1Q253_9RHOO|nr:hypothetical protein [Aromatoleum toluvorans]NMG45794.1 hypothetical protein [Aromatoleum toluvorans]